MIDLEDILARMIGVAAEIAEDGTQKANARLQAAGAAVRTCSALAAIRGAQHAREADDLIWLARAVERPAGALSGPSGAQVEHMRVERIGRILEAHALPRETELPDW